MFLEVKNVTKSIHGDVVIKNVSLCSERGRVIGLRGINGSGKTMLMRLISGLIRPTKGQVLIDGEVVSKDIPFPKSLGVLIEGPAFLDESGVDMLGDIVKKEKDRGAVLIVSSHDRDILEDISDEIYDLEQGEIVRHSIKGEKRSEG